MLKRTFQWLLNLLSDDCATLHTGGTTRAAAPATTRRDRQSTDTPGTGSNRSPTFRKAQLQLYMYRHCKGQDRLHVDLHVCVETADKVSLGRRLRS